jgi:hypothetical protein
LLSSLPYDSSSQKQGETWNLCSLTSTFSLWTSGRRDLHETNPSVTKKNLVCLLKKHIRPLCLPYHYEKHSSMWMTHYFSEKKERKNRLHHLLNEEMF